MRTFGAVKLTAPTRSGRSSLTTSCPWQSGQACHWKDPPVRLSRSGTMLGFNRNRQQFEALTALGKSAGICLVGICPKSIPGTDWNAF
jgi:hypothetical protein